MAITPVLAARKLKNSLKNIFITFGQTKCIFVTTKVEALISQNIREINFLIQNHWSVLTETRSYVTKIEICSTNGTPRSGYF